MKKFLLLFCALLTSVSGVFATTTSGTTYKVTKANGTCYHTTNGQINSGFGHKFVSSNNVLTFQCTNDKINFGYTTDNGFRINQGNTTTAFSYTISVAEGYTIVSYTLGAAPNGGNNNTLVYSLNSDMSSSTTIQKNGTTTSVTETVNASTKTFYLKHGNAMPIDVTLTVVVKSVVEPVNGIYTFKCNGSQYGQYNASWASSWISDNEEPQLTLSCTGANINASNARMFPGTSGSSTYTLSVSGSEDYVIEGYTITGKGNGGTQKLTPFAGTPVSFTTSGNQTVTVSGIYSPSTTFTMDGQNNAVIISTFEVRVRKVSDLSKSDITVHAVYNGTDIQNISINNVFKDANINYLLKANSDNACISSLRRDFCTRSYYSDALCTSSITTVPENATDIYVKYEDNTSALPFTVSTAEYKTWYYLKARNYYLGYDNDNSAFSVNESQKFGNDAQWAFIGNCFEGFRIINKSATEGTNVYSNLTDEQDVIMNTVAQNWVLFNHPVADYSFITGTNSSAYISSPDNGGNIHFKVLNVELTSSNDAVKGGSFAFEAVPENFASYAAPYLAYVNNNVGEYFALTSESNTALATYDSENITQEEFLEIVDAFKINYPSTGNYRIKNVSSSNYIGYGTAGQSGKGIGLIEVSANEPSSILHLTKVSDGVYTISTQGLNVQTQSTRDQPVRANNNTASNYTFTPLSPTVVSIRADLNDAKGYLFRSSWGNAPESIITWEVSSDVAKWTIEDAEDIEVTLKNGGDEYYYATSYLDFPVFSTDNCLYYLSGTGSEKVTATRVDAVPANEGFLIRCAAGDDTGNTKTITLTIPSTTPGAITTNLLSGNCAATTVEASSVYVFSKVNDDLGFYLYSGTDMPANRAYIPASALGQQSSRGFVLSFEDEVTGISSIVNAQSSNGIFDLQGRRVNNATHGLYIQNGKKVLF